jgi:hypothetical protein
VLNLEGSIFVREINEVALIKIEELEVISGLNSVPVSETTGRLELQDNLAFDYDVSPDMTDILVFVKYGDYAFGFVGDTAFP